jgi:NADPH:quinone reductase-like Zn-dependent oxidoreductase
VLIVGATTSIGLVGVQLAKALGASRVLATTTSQAKAPHLAAAGADVIINTQTESLDERALAATDGEGVDIALDHVGGQLFADLLPATRLGGMIVNIGRLAGPVCSINLDQLSFRRLRVRGTTFSVRTSDERAEVCAALAADVLPAVADGRIRPVVDRVLAFADADAAAAHMRSNRAVGKIVLELPHPGA